MHYISAQRILLSCGNIQNAEALLRDKELQIDLAEPDTAICSGRCSILLDFGRELSGGVRILTHLATAGQTRVRLRFGESASECCAELGEKNATNDHAPRDFEVNIGFLSDVCYGNTGFRFLRLDTLDEGAHFAFKSIVAASDADERAELGSFVCDDALVNEIWNTAAYTLRLCLHNGYVWDGVKRDRLVWIGDLYPEMRAAYCLYGHTPEVERSLALAQKHTPLPAWINSIPMYSAWWLYILADLYLREGNEAFVRERLNYVHGLIAQLDACVTADGDTTFEFNFIDWPTHPNEGENGDKREDEAVGVSYLLSLTMKKTAWLLEALGEPSDVCKSILARLSKKTHTVKRYKQIAALGVLAGEKTDAARELLLRGGAEGFSTFMSYFLLSAVAAYGEYESALAMLKEYYGGMLQMGATTFWEDFDLSWMKDAVHLDELPQNGQKDIHGDFGRYCYTGFRHSFCHGWSSGVIAYLAETVAGIREMGNDCVRIEPHLSGLSFVKLSYPTKHGILRLEIRAQKDGKVKTKIRAPKGLHVICTDTAEKP